MFENSKGFQIPNSFLGLILQPTHFLFPSFLFFFRVSPLTGPAPAHLGLVAQLTSPSPAPRPETPALEWMHRCSARATGFRPLSRPHVRAFVASVSRHTRVCPRFRPNTQLPSFARQPQSPRESRRKVYPQPRLLKKSSINLQRTLKEIHNSVGIWIQGIVPRPPGLLDL
jgi:hypothetical protein